MKASILELYPTQLALGLYEVNAKIKEFKAMSSNELRDYLKKNPVPFVLGPKNRLSSI
ncbi:MAG TPA: ParB-like protein [Fimbriimonadaceae bacterium]